MAKFSMKKDGKEVGPASTYAEPHTMSGESVSGGLPAMSTETGVEYVNRMNISVGSISKTGRATVKTSGVKQRGSGAATKGFTSRGPLA